MDDKFAIALSERTGEEATREVSLKIKATFPKAIKTLFFFFTPHFQPGFIATTVQFTLKPQMFIGIQAPYLIFEEKIIEKGIIALCINKEEAQLKVSQLKDDHAQGIESDIRRKFVGFSGEHHFLFPFFGQRFNYKNYLRAIDLSVKKGCSILGGGFAQRYGTKNQQIVQQNIDEGLINILGRGIQIDLVRISNLLPLGKSFTITKAVSNKNIIVEIDGKPAVELYRHYLEEKFMLFKKSGLFPFYPLGIKKNGIIRIVHITDVLEDGSFVCIGDIHEKAEGHIMTIHAPTAKTMLKAGADSLRSRDGKLVFVLNSTWRKKMLKEYAAEEIVLLKRFLGEDIKMLGIYTDYSMYSDRELGKTTIEPGVILTSLWQ